MSKSEESSSIKGVLLTLSLKICSMCWKYIVMTSPPTDAHILLVSTDRPPRLLAISNWWLPSATTMPKNHYTGQWRLLSWCSPASVYQCTVGRPTLGRLGAVLSTAHLKMKFYSTTDEAVTLQADLHSARRCHFIGLKEQGEHHLLQPSIKCFNNENTICCSQPFPLSSRSSEGLMLQNIILYKPCRFMFSLQQILARLPPLPNPTSVTLSSTICYNPRP